MHPRHSNGDSPGRSTEGRSAGRIEVWHDGGAWRWLYREAEGDVVLLGNRSRPTRAAIVAAARAAYPGVPVLRPVRRGGAVVRALIAAAIGAVGTFAVLTSVRRPPLPTGRRRRIPGFSV